MKHERRDKVKSKIEHLVAFAVMSKTQISLAVGFSENYLSSIISPCSYRNYGDIKEETFNNIMAKLDEFEKNKTMRKPKVKQVDIVENKKYTEEEIIIIQAALVIISKK